MNPHLSRQHLLPHQYRFRRDTDSFGGCHTAQLSAGSFLYRSLSSHLSLRLSFSVGLTIVLFVFGHTERRKWCPDCTLAVLFITHSFLLMRSHQCASDTMKDHWTYFSHLLRFYRNKRAVLQLSHCVSCLKTFQWNLFLKRFETSQHFWNNLNSQIIFDSVCLLPAF